MGTQFYDCIFLLPPTSLVFNNSSLRNFTGTNCKLSKSLLPLQAMNNGCEEERKNYKIFFATTQLLSVISGSLFVIATPSLSLNTRLWRGGSRTTSRIVRFFYKSSSFPFFFLILRNEEIVPIILSNFCSEIVAWT